MSIKLIWWLWLMGCMAASAAAADLTITVPSDVPAGTYILTPQTTPPIPPNPGGDTPFTALHTYFISPTGNDNNNGTSAATPWLTPNHPVVCGDVIVAAPGAHNQNFTGWGTVSTCPSTTGGIDGKGGVYFAVLLCGGTDLGSNGCKIDCTVAACAPGVAGTKAAMDINRSNWAVEGWTVNGNTTGARGMQSDACASGTTILHHHAFINDLIVNANSAYGTNECALNHNHPGNGIDQFAVIGTLNQNAAADSICLAAVDDVAPAVYDSTPGTHVFFYGNFTFTSVSIACRPLYDIENYMFDTWDAHAYGEQGVIANNIGYNADRQCIHVTTQDFSTPTPPMKIYNNTCFQDNTHTNGNWMNGEINTGLIRATKSTAVFTIKDNIGYQPLKASNPSGGVAAFVMNPADAFTISGNVFRANNSGCIATSCNPTFDTSQFGGTSALLGTNNTYVDPAFKNTTDLLANHVGLPDCTSFATTTECAGWNAVTSTLTTPSIISDLVPTANGTAGKGYQLPSTTCAANADFPTWLKGIVQLAWTGSAVVQRHGLVTTPCGL